MRSRSQDSMISIKNVEENRDFYFSKVTKSADTENQSKICF